MTNRGNQVKPPSVIWFALGLGIVLGGAVLLVFVDLPWMALGAVILGAAFVGLGVWRLARRQ
ncbi:MAG: hypothetical protein ACOH19_06155 [Rhodoglobus sp.]